MKTFIKILVKTLVIILLLISLFFVIQRFFFKEEIPSIMGVSYIQIITGSMEPTYKVNDFVMIKKTDDVKSGDVIIYKENDYYVTHRLIKIDENNYITKGDANSATEEISSDQVIGKVIYYSAFISLLINVLRNPIVLVLIGLCVVLTGYFGGIHEKKKDEKAI